MTPELCVGCKLCVADCPYGALTMQPREDGSRYKLLAVVDPERCVACGICVGSCNTLAQAQGLGLGERPAGLLWQDVSGRLKLARADEIPTRVVFACERHVAHGARPFLRRSADDPVQTAGELQLEVVPLTCAAMAHPGLLARTLEAGAAEVQLVGCPPDDCANREGNLWLEARLARERAPRLKRAFASAPIFGTWLPPDRFAEALAPRPPEAAEAKTPEPREEKDEEERLTWDGFLLAPTWRHLVAGLALATLFLVPAVALASFPYAP